jgi:hypothetical protein
MLTTEAQMVLEAITENKFVMGAIVLATGLPVEDVEPAVKEILQGVND